MTCDICGAGKVSNPANNFGEEISVAPETHTEWCPAKESE